MNSAQRRNLPEFCRSILLSYTTPAPLMRLIHQATIKQHSGDDFTSTEVLFPSVTSRSQKAAEDMQAERLFITNLLWQLGQHTSH